MDLFVARYVDFTYDSVPRPGQGQWCQWKGLNVMCGPRGLKIPVNALYHNNGDGTFTDVSKKSGITNTSGCYGFTSVTADFDHDGWPDIYVACDSTPSLLYHNNHDGTFTEMAKAAGVAYNEDGTLQGSMGVSADDFTHSGLQDIVKTNFSDDTSTLYLNRGNNLFDDVTQIAGLAKITRLLGWGVQFFDFDNSGWPGILIANGHVYPEVDGKGLGTSYREPKVAYYNLHNGKFADITTQGGAVLSEPHAAHGMALGDLFNNGREAAVVNNMNEPPSIYYNTAPVGNFISLQLVGSEIKSRRAGRSGNARARRGQARTGSSQRRRLYFAKRSAIAFRSGQRDESGQNRNSLAERSGGDSEGSARESILRGEGRQRRGREANSRSERDRDQEPLAALRNEFFQDALPIEITTIASTRIPTPVQQ